MAKTEIKNKWHTAIKIIIILAISSFIVSWCFSAFTDVEFKGGNVALIPIKGTILSEGGRSFGQEVASSPTIVKFMLR